MKLRNKITGAIHDIDELPLGLYNSLAEIMGEWEDYKPQKLSSRELFLLEQACRRMIERASEIERIHKRAQYAKDMRKEYLDIIHKLKDIDGVVI